MEFVVMDYQLYLGDCLEVLKSIPSASIDMVFIDPPYGHNNNSNGDLISRREAALGVGTYIPEQNNRPILNDGLEADEIFKRVLPELNRILKSNGVIACCCGGGGPDPMFARWSLWLDEIFQFKQMIIWDKGPIGMGWHYRRSYETVLVAQKGNSCAWYDTSNQIENIIRPGRIKKIIPREDQHPTEKPFELAEHFIKLHTKPGDTILDCFMGSGSTGEAALRNKRKFIGIELDNHWFEVAKKRLESLIELPEGQIIKIKNEEQDINLGLW
jgi:site-specific DNA-methyltransferase (adenine-specific)